MRLALPGVDTESTEDVLNNLADNDLSTVTKDASRCSPLPDVILEGTYKLIVGLDAVDVGDIGIITNEYHGRLGTVVNGRRIQVDNVTRHGFRSTSYIESWVC